MALRWLIVSALLVYGLSLVGASVAPRPVEAGNPSSKKSASLPPDPPRLMVGFALNLHHTDNVELYLKSIDQIADMGFNTVEILTPMFQQNGASEEMGVIIAPGKSPRREDLVNVLKRGRERGLTTILMPLVLFDNPRGNEWRGKIQPERWDKWWASYRRNVDYFVDIANESGVSVFSVGSELLSTESKYNDRWESLIAHVRKKFRGRLSYSTNWDHFDKPTFWSKVDMIGISCYWDMTKFAKEDPPEDEALAKRWQQVRKQVLDFGEAKEKPVFLTEIGYPSLPWGLKDPWNYVNTKDAKPAPAVQAQGYKAFLTAWDDLLSRSPRPDKFTGVCFFEWDVYQNGGPTDTGYGVRGKPAYDVLEKWLAGRRTTAAKP